MPLPLRGPTVQASAKPQTQSLPNTTTNSITSTSSSNSQPSSLQSHTSSHMSSMESESVSQPQTPQRSDRGSQPQTPQTPERHGSLSHSQSEASIAHTTSPSQESPNVTIPRSDSQLLQHLSPTGSESESVNFTPRGHDVRQQIEEAAMDDSEQGETTVDNSRDSGEGTMPFARYVTLKLRKSQGEYRQNIYRLKDLLLINLIEWDTNFHILPQFSS